MRKTTIKKGKNVKRRKVSGAKALTGSRGTRNVASKGKGTGGSATYKRTSSKKRGNKTVSKGTVTFGDGSSAKYKTVTKTPKRKNKHRTVAYL